MAPTDFNALQFVGMAAMLVELRGLIGLVAQLRLGDSLGESSALGGSDAQACPTKISHDELERVQCGAEAAWFSGYLV